MKLSYFAAGALIVSSAACGRFGEVSLDIQALDANKVVQLTRNGQQFPATITKLEFEFDGGLLTGDKQESEIFANQVVTLDLGDELVNQVAAGDLVIKSDKLYDDFEFNLIAVRMELEADLNNLNGPETVITVELEDINELFQFANLGANSFKNNFEMVLQFDPKNALTLIDLQDLINRNNDVNDLNNPVNVNSLNLDQAFNINDNDSPDEVSDAIDNVTDLDLAFVSFIYNLKAQQVRVKAQ